MQNISLGQLVLADAGRDKNKSFIVICIINEQYVYISDGDTRTIEKPKRKNIKHLKLQDIISEQLRQKIVTNTKIQNSEIKNFIKSCYKISGTGGLIT